MTLAMMVRRVLMLLVVNMWSRIVLLVECQPVSQCSSTSEHCMASVVSASTSQEDSPKDEEYVEALLLEASHEEARMSEVTLLQVGQSRISASITEKIHLNDTVARGPVGVVVSHAAPTAALKQESAEVFGSRRRTSSFSISPRRRSGSFSVSPRRRSFSVSPRRRSGAGFFSQRRRSVHGGHVVYHPIGVGYDHHVGFGYHPAYGAFGPHYFHGYSYTGMGFLEFICSLVLICVCCPCIFIMFGCVSCMEMLTSCFPCCFPRRLEFSEPSPFMCSYHSREAYPCQSQSRHRPIPLKANLSSGGVDIPFDVAKDFLAAVWNEYLNGVDSAVQVLFDELESRGFSPEIGRALEAEEQRFQVAADKQRVYDDLVARWRAEEVFSNGVAIPLDLAQAFLAAVEDEYLHGLDNAVGLFFDDLTVRGVLPDICRVLDEEEQFFQSSYDPEDAYNQLAVRWGMA